MISLFLICTLLSLVGDVEVPSPPESLKAAVAISLGKPSVFNRSNLFPLDRSKTMGGLILNKITQYEATSGDNISTNSIWMKRFGTGSIPGIDGATSINVQEDGSVVVTGTSQAPSTNYDYVTIKYDSAGYQRWTARDDGPGHYTDWITSSVSDNEGNVYVTGYSYGDSTAFDIQTIKYNSGCPVRMRYDYDATPAYCKEVPQGEALVSL